MDLKFFKRKKLKKATNLANIVKTDTPSTFYVLDIDLKILEEPNSNKYDK